MGGETVLLVDDNPDVRTCVGELLRIHGFSILEAADGEDALRIAQSLRPIEVLVTDINMPGIDGLELARRVRALRPAIAVLYMSGVPAHEVARLGLTGTVFLSKPFDADLLLEHVRDVTRRGHEGRACTGTPSRAQTGLG